MCLSQLFVETGKQMTGSCQNRWIATKVIKEKIGPQSVHRYKQLARDLLVVFILSLVEFFCYLYRRRVKFATGVKYQSLTLLYISK